MADLKPATASAQLQSPRPVKRGTPWGPGFLGLEAALKAGQGHLPLKPAGLRRPPVGAEAG